MAACAPPPARDPSVEGEGERRDVVFFLRRLRTLDHLPALEHAHTAMESTWDRTGGNEDDKDFKQIEGDRNVLLDVDGPGCVHRICTGLLGEVVEGTRIQIFLDHASSPTFDMPVEQYFSEKKGVFPYPLVSLWTYPGSHFPIPFAKHIRIQLESREPEKRWGVYWQVTYTRFKEGTEVESLHWPLSQREQRELDHVVESWLAARMEPAPPPSLAHTLSLPADTRRVIRLSGSGVVRELRVSTDPATAEVLRGVRLKVFWDGRDTPSMDLPLGYLFGHGDSGFVPLARFNSLLLGITEREAYFRFPMPYRAGAAFQFENRSGAACQLSVKLDVEARQVPSSWGRLHATWHRRRAALPDAPKVGPREIPAHRVLEHDGPGKYVGALLYLDWPFFWPWWGEGDWLIWTDESGWPPSYHGTGSEEYFNSGYTLFGRKAISGYVTTRPGPVGLYSFHLNDAFHFRTRIRVMLETVGSLGGEFLIPLLRPAWGTTALWYAPEAGPAKSEP